MTPERFEAELRWAGWLALAQREFVLRPSEVDTLATLLRSRGRIVTVESLALYEGKSSTGTREGVFKRVERLRRRLEDADCPGTVEKIPGPDGFTMLGFMITAQSAALIEAALRASLCVGEARAA